jgi:hypothetical protein
VSDEWDQSPDTWEYYRDHLVSLKAGLDMLHVHAIAGDYPTGCGTAAFGEGYYEVVTDLGGSFVSVCSTNWADNITDLAEASLREREFPLSNNTPAEGTIVVTVDGVVVNEWTYDTAANSVVFDHDSIPESGAEIIIDYAVLVECP